MRGNARSALVGPSSAASVHAVTGATMVPIAGFPGSRLGRALAALRRLLFSFETLFVLFLYSNNFKPFLPPFPIDETVVFALASGLAALVVLYRTGLRTDAFDLLVFALLFFGWLTLTTLWSPATDSIGRSVGYNLTFNLFCLLAAAYVLAADRVRLRRFLGLLVVVGLFFALHGSWIYFEFGTFRFYRGFTVPRAYLAWTFPVSTAATVVLAYAVGSPLGSWRQLFFLALLLVLGFFLLVASARGPALSFITGLLVLLAVLHPEVVRGRLRLPPVTIAAIGLSLAVVVYLAHLLASGTLPDTLTQFVNLLGYLRNNPDAVRYQRVHYWLFAIDLWQRAPLFGNGIAAFAFYYGHGLELPGAHPHNIVLEILAEMGLVGLSLFILFVGCALRRVELQRLRTDPPYLAIVVSFAGLFLVRAMTSSDLAGQQELFVFTGLLLAVPPHVDRNSAGGHLLFLFANTPPHSGSGGRRREPAAPVA